MSVSVWLQAAGRVEPGAGEAEPEHRPPVETHRLHPGPAGRPAGGRGPLGQAAQTAGAPPPHHVVLCYMIALASLLDCLSHILWFMKKYATVK